MKSNKVKKSNVKIKEDLLSQFFNEKFKSRTTICLRCGYRWIRRSKDKLPKNCAKCCSPYWNKLRRNNN